MLQRLLFALGFAFSGVLATTGSAAAAFDPSRDELMGITAAAVGILIAFLTLVYAIKWYFGWDQQRESSDMPPPDAHGHH